MVDHDTSVDPPKCLVNDRKIDYTRPEVFGESARNFLDKQPQDTRIRQLAVNHTMRWASNGFKSYFATSQTQGTLTLRRKKPAPCPHFETGAPDGFNLVNTKEDSGEGTDYPEQRFPMRSTHRSADRRLNQRFESRFSVAKASSTSFSFFRWSLSVYPSTSLTIPCTFSSNCCSQGSHLVFSCSLFMASDNKWFAGQSTKQVPIDLETQRPFYKRSLSHIRLSASESTGFFADSAQCSRAESQNYLSKFDYNRILFATVITILLSTCDLPALR